MNHIQGDLLKVSRGVLVHQVNLLGIMGGGIALQIRQKWPHVYAEYADLCADKKLKLGDVHFVQVDDELHIANLAGQQDIGGVATVYTAYKIALPKVKDYADERGLPIYYPYGIGCGLAGGDWSIMKPILNQWTPDATLVEFVKGGVQ